MEWIKLDGFSKVEDEEKKVINIAFTKGYVDPIYPLRNLSKDIDEVTE